ncbi:preprotein translocase subunit YajC [Nocardioides sp.]|uniref:preprotein translocase subunit YajC n=1 Tax=Nocardioides sp. TaxID=35761 RepID=UPI002733534C|nr:preprotein translocase subunit YajC [Nocardioides sp.]MDP3893222.1 preprotein translocase subunit YajC [Nocardioides sp.]
MEFLPLVAIALLFWLLLIRPQARRQKQLAQLQAGVQPGDRVVLGSGIYGQVRAVDDEGRLSLEVADGVTLTVARGAVVSVEEPAERPEASDHIADSDDAAPGDS